MEDLKVELEILEADYLIEAIKMAIEKDDYDEKKKEVLKKTKEKLDEAISTAILII